MLLAASGIGNMSTIFFFVLIVGFMYFMMIRPQRKQQQDRKSMMDSLKVGDEIVTIGRLHGLVDKIDQENKTVTIDCEGVYLVFDMTAIMRVDKADTKEDKSKKSNESSKGKK